MRRFDGAVNWPEMHTYTRKFLHSSSMYNLFNITSSYLHVAVSKKRAAVMKLFNGSHKSKKTRRNSAAPPPHRELFTQRISGISDSKFLCCHLVEIEDVITPRKITLFKYKSWTEQQIRCRQNVVISRTSVSRFEEERKLNQSEVNNCGKVTLEGR